MDNRDADPPIVTAWSCIKEWVKERLMDQSPRSTFESLITMIRPPLMHVVKRTNIFRLAWKVVLAQLIRLGARLWPETSGLGK